MEPFYERWGNNIRAARRHIGMTQVQLAERVGVVFSTVGRWEAGRTIPGERHRRVLAEVLGVPEADLFPLEGDEA